MTRNKLG